jgi:pyrrolysine biosynthesis protein PylC
VKRVGPELKGWILQEYLEGPSYSIEVMGVADHYEALQVTEIVVDSRYDCNRVLAPAETPKSLNKWIKEIALTIARDIHLKGIMDVEVILNRGVPKVLEIDARLPSQTPTAVYESTGINMLELLRDIFVTGVMPRIPESRSPRGVVYEHVRASRRGLEFAGEHMMGQVASLEIVQDFFGADLGVTNFDSSSLPWVATLITTADTPRQAWLKRERVIGNIRRHLERPLGNRARSDAVLSKT